jgi:hypothetical protein
VQQPTCFAATVSIPQARAGFMLGGASSFVVFYEGNGSHQLGLNTVFRQGMTFLLPGLSIQVAPEMQQHTLVLGLSDRGDSRKPSLWAIRLS